MKIFLDFDGTLFDTRERFKRDLFSVFVSLGIPLEIVEETYAEMFAIRIHGGFLYSPRRHLEILQTKGFLNRDENEILKKLGSFMKGDLSRYVFPDVLPFLRSFAKEELYILTFGEKVFQREKIVQSGIGKYMADIFVTQDEKYKTIARICGEDTENIFFVDDSVAMISEMNQSLSWVNTLLVSRPGRRQDDLKEKECDFEVRNLEEARDIIIE